MSETTHVTNTYFPAEVERRWQERWEQEGTNRYTDAELRRVGASGKPFYNPAEGLHGCRAKRAPCPARWSGLPARER